MPGLNENHKRRILSTFQYMDKLLEDSLTSLRPTARPLFPRLTQDISPAQLHWIESYAEKMREQMGKLMERFEARAEEKVTPASWALRTNLVYLDISLEDLYPERMRGYGEVGPDAARDLSWTLNEIRRLVSQLSAFLAESRGMRTARPAPAGGAAADLLARIAGIIARHGLVEFFPALQSVSQKQESHRFEIAVFGRVSSGKSSLINRLLEIRALPVGSTPMTAVPIRILAGAAPKLRVTFAHGVENLPIERLPEFASEQGNPANSKRVTAIEIQVPSARLQAGVAFVDTPGIASLATTGAQLAYAYLPESDLGLVLVDGHGSIGREDLDLLRALHEAGIPPIVLVSKCDLLSPPDVDRVVSYTRDAIKSHLGVSPEVVAISSVDSWAPAVVAWFQRAIEPLLHDSRLAVSASIERKVESLRRALLASLELTAGRGAAGPGRLQNAEQALRPLDDGLEELKRKWRSALDDLSPWAEEILEEAATRMAEAAENAGATSPSGSDHPLAEAALHTVASRCHTFVREYEEFEEMIRRQLKSSQGNGSGSLALDAYELPKVAALPQPMVDRLQEVTIAQLGPIGHLIRGSRLRHFRRELRNKAGDQIEKVLREFRPRLRHWLVSMLKDLEESYRLQTDPLRYTSASPASGQAAGELQEDIRLLREFR